MELKRHARSISDNIYSLYFLIGFYALLTIFFLIYSAILSRSGIVYNQPPKETYFDFQKTPPSEMDKENFLPPTPPPPPKEDISEVPEIVENDTIIEKDTLVETKVENENIDTGENTQSSENSGETTSDGDGGVGDGGGIYFIVDKMPEFPGGDMALRKYIAENVRYPGQAHKSGIKGLVYVRFCVTAEGMVEKVEIVRGVNPLLDQEALRVVQSLPKWTPGERKGKKVSVWYSVPINFQLN